MVRVPRIYGADWDVGNKTVLVRHVGNGDPAGRSGLGEERPCPWSVETQVRRPGKDTGNPRRSPGDVLGEHSQGRGYTSSKYAWLVRLLTDLLRADMLLLNSVPLDAKKWRRSGTCWRPWLATGRAGTRTHMCRSKRGSDLKV